MQASPRREPHPRGHHMVAPRHARAEHQGPVQAPPPRPLRSLERRVPILGRGSRDHLGRVQVLARYPAVRGHGALRRHRRDGEPALVGSDDRGDGQHAQGRARVQRRGLRRRVPRRRQSRDLTLRRVTRDIPTRTERYRARLQGCERHREDAFGHPERRRG